jgi:hypothetical protein
VVAPEDAHPFSRAAGTGAPRMTTADISFVARRDELIQSMLDVLRPQTDAAALTVQQHVELQAAIAQYTADVLEMMR